VNESARIDSIPRWFEGVHLNFAENLLYSRIPGVPTSQRAKKGKEDAKIALTEVREGASEIRNVSWGQLRKEVGQLASAMREHGVVKGDRVVVVASNSVDTLKVFLAVTTLGGLFSSSSTDMGVRGVLQRALQVTPKVDLNFPVRNLDIADTKPTVHIYGRLRHIQWQKGGSTAQDD
jgi:acetoacetyl-CoA synthetase